MQIIRKFDEELTLKDFESMKREAQMFTKNVRRISTPKELFRVWDASIDWAEKFERFAFQQVLGIVPRGEHIKGAPSMGTEKAWSLVIRLSDTFKPNPGYDPQRFGVYGRKDYSEEYWSLIYKMFDEERDKRYQRLSKLVREAFKDLETVFSEYGTLRDLSKTEYAKVGGINLRVVTVEGDEGNQRIVKSQVDAIKQAVLQIERKKFGYVCKGLDIIVDPNHYTQGSSAGMVAGEYSPNEDEVRIFDFADTKTVIHEIGHRLYYKYMSESAVKDWEDFVENDYLRIDESSDIVRYLRSAFDKALEEAWADEFHLTDPWDVMEKYIEDEFTRWLFGLIREQKIAPLVMIDRDRLPDAERFWRMFIERITKKPIMIHSVSDYGNTNPVEAFAETFTHYVMDRKLPDVVYQLFIQLTGIRR